MGLGSAGNGLVTVPGALTQGGLRLDRLPGGLQLSLPLRNRIAQADAARDEIQLRQAQGRSLQLENQIRQQIENAAIAVETAHQAYTAAVESRNYQQQLLQAEKDKFSVGESTNYPDGSGPGLSGAGSINRSSSPLRLDEGPDHPGSHLGNHWRKTTSRSRMPSEASCRKKATADLSTALRCARDVKFVAKVWVPVTKQICHPERSAVERSAVAFRTAVANLPLEPLRHAESARTQLTAPRYLPRYRAV